MTTWDTYRFTVYVLSIALSSVKLSKELRLFALSLPKNVSPVGSNNELSNAISEYEIEIQIALSLRYYYKVKSLFYFKKAFHFRHTQPMSMVKYGAYAIYCTALWSSKWVLYVLVLCKGTPGTVFRLIPITVTLFSFIVIPAFDSDVATSLVNFKTAILKPFVATYFPIDTSHAIPVLINNASPSTIGSFPSDNGTTLGVDSLSPDGSSLPGDPIPTAVPFYLKKRHFIISGVLVLCVLSYFARRHFGGGGFVSSPSMNPLPGTAEVGTSSTLPVNDVEQSSNWSSAQFVPDLGTVGRSILDPERQSLTERGLVPLQPSVRPGLPLPYRTGPPELRMVNYIPQWVFPN